MDKLLIHLTLDEVNAVINVLGQMPTSAGVWPLLMNIRDQAQMQLPADLGGVAHTENTSDAFAVEEDVVGKKGGKSAD